MFIGKQKLWCAQFSNKDNLNEYEYSYTCDVELLG